MFTGALARPRHSLRIPTINVSAQLALPVTLADYATFDNYYPVGNEAAVSALCELDPVRTRSVWLAGPPNVGKSHLLQAVCAGRNDSAYLPGATLRDMPHGVLDGFERYARVCIDDIDLLLGDASLETALFHLYNRLADASGCLIVSALVAAPAAQFTLADLGSRLRAGSALRLTSLDDDGRLGAMKLRARRRGFTLPEKTGRYLLTHYRRDMASLCALLDTLDLASLAARRQVTIPFVKTILSRDD